MSYTIEEEEEEEGEEEEEEDEEEEEEGGRGSVAAIRKRSRDRRCISCIASGIDNRRCLISRYRRGSTIPPFIHSDTH